MPNKARKTLKDISGQSLLKRKSAPVGQGHMARTIAIAAVVGTSLALATTVSTGDLTVKAAGMEMTLKSDSQRGVVVKINGSECPGAGCPSFALDWNAARRG